MTIFLGSDHRGFELKEKLKSWLVSRDYIIVDEGNLEYDPGDDFPDFALRVAEKVSQGKGIGVLFCGSGGMALAANKVKGVRAVEVFDIQRARHAKEHDRANVIAIPADAVGEEQAKEMVREWIKAEPKFQEKYKRRLEKIEEIEEKYFK